MIVTYIRWYYRFALSLRDLEELMAERGLSVDHTTIWRWAQTHGPKVYLRLQGEVKRKSSTWHMDETFVRIAGKWKYLFRAVDGQSQTIDFYLSETRDREAAKLFLKKGRETSELLSLVHGDDLEETGDPFPLELHRALDLGRGVLARAFLLGVRMAVLDIREPVFPAPGRGFESTCMREHGWPCGFFAARKLALVVRPRLCRFRDGGKGPFVKCLTQKSRVRLTAVRHSCIPALFDSGVTPAYDWISAALENRSRCVPNAAIRRGISASPAPGRESKIAKFRCDLVSCSTHLFALTDVLLDGLNLPHDCLDHEQRRPNHGLIVRGANDFTKSRLST